MYEYLTKQSISAFKKENYKSQEHSLVSSVPIIQRVIEGGSFEHLLNDYFLSDKPQDIGLPSVQYCAEQLHLSSNYFGDLIKKETGKSPQEHIQLKLIDTAKEKIFDPSKSISEVAYELGFKYPQHFTRLFKKVVGCSPNEYRQAN